MNPVLLAELLKALPTLLAVLPTIINLFKKNDPKQRNIIPTPVDIVIPDDIPVPSIPIPVPSLPTKKFAHLRLDLQWVDGSNARNAEFLAGGAVNWGSYIRYDSNPVDDNGDPISVEEVMALPIPEWFWTWDGEASGGPINKGGNAFEESKGFDCAFKIFKQFEDTKRHKFVVWNKTAGVESNRVTLDVD